MLLGGQSGWTLGLRENPRQRVAKFAYRKELKRWRDANGPIDQDHGFNVSQLDRHHLQLH